MIDKYLRSALTKAVTMLGNRGRLLTLLLQLTLKVNRENLNSDYWKARLFLIGRLLRAYATGTYQRVPAQSILLILACVIYFINPFDLIPDALLGIGLTDDLAILTSVYNLVSHELKKFEDWESQSDR